MLRTILLDQCLNSFMVEPHPSAFYVHLMNAPRPSLYFFFFYRLSHLCTVNSNQRIKETIMVGLGTQTLILRHAVVGFQSTESCVVVYMAYLVSQSHLEPEFTIKSCVSN